MTTLYVLVGFIAFCQFLQLIRMLVAWRNNVRVKQQMEEDYKRYMKELKKIQKEKEKNEKR
jgi:hypothetical protein